MPIYDCDASVLGLGGAGPVIARSLVEEGLSVIGLERGGPPPPRTPDELRKLGPEKRYGVSVVSNRGDVYYSGDLEPDPNDCPHVYRDSRRRLRATKEGWTATNPGGGTTLYGGVSIRFHPRDFCLGDWVTTQSDLSGPTHAVEDLRRDVENWPISALEFEPYYWRTEEAVGINGTAEGQSKEPFRRYAYQSPLPPCEISTIAEKGMVEFGMRPYRTPQAYITRDHAPTNRSVRQDLPLSRLGYLNGYPDASGFKSSTAITHLKPILSSPNFMMNCYCTAYQIEARGDRVTTVRYFDALGRARRIRARVVILALSAVETIRLLWLSAAARGFRHRINASGLLGCHFMSHVFAGADLVVDRGRYNKAFGLESDWATDFCQQEAFLREHRLWAGGVLYNLANNGGLPIAFACSYRDQGIDRPWRSFLDRSAPVGDGLIQLLDESWGRVATVMAMANQVPQRSNRIHLEPTVQDRLGLPVAKIDMTWHPQDEAVTVALAEQCRDILQTGSGLPVHSYGGVCQSDNANCRLNHHLLGGARFGTDPKRSVLDADCRAWGFENLYVADGSFMPTGGGANPTLTIQANALRVAELISKRI